MGEEEDKERREERKNQIQILTQLLGSCVTLREISGVPEPQFPHLYYGNNLCLPWTVARPERGTEGSN